MNLVLRYAICGGLVFPFAAFVLHAQDTAAKSQVTIDYANDPCGNPMIESQSWALVKGKVSRVIDGRTLMVTLPHNSHPLRVYLVGVGIGAKEQATTQAKELLSQLLHNMLVEILVNPSWNFAHKKPSEVTGAVHLENSMVGADDVGLLLLSKGLLKFQEPAPYSVSRYTECRYKRAEAEAQTKKIGVWATAG